MHQPRLPRQLSKRPWLVHVFAEVPDFANLSPAEIADLAEELGIDPDGEELAEIIGPTPDYQPMTSYGPYNEKDATALAAYLNQQEIREALGIDMATIGQLSRYDIDFEMLLAKSSLGTSASRVLASRTPPKQVALLMQRIQKERTT